MKNAEGFFRAMAWLCLGMVLGFLLAPIKRGITMSICSDNVGAEHYDFLQTQKKDDPDDLDDDEEL